MQFVICFVFFKGGCNDGAECGQNDNAGRRCPGCARARFRHLLPVLAWSAPQGVQLVKAHRGHTHREQTGGLDLYLFGLGTPLDYSRRNGKDFPPTVLCKSLKSFLISHVLLPSSQTLL